MLDEVKDKIVWNKTAFKAFLIVAVLMFIIESLFAFANGSKSSFSWGWEWYVFCIFGYFMLMGPLIAWDLLCASFSGCFSFWSEKIKLRTPLYKALVLGGCASFIIYGGEFILLILYRRNIVIDEFWSLQWFLLRVITFTLIYAYEVCKADEKFKVKAPKNKKKKSV